jgi:hypothetical protein
MNFRIRIHNFLEMLDPDPTYNEYGSTTMGPYVKVIPPVWRKQQILFFKMLLKETWKRTGFSEVFALIGSA